MGMRLDIDRVAGGGLSATEALFSESNTRFLVEVKADLAGEFEQLIAAGDVPVYRLGTIETRPQLVVCLGGDVVLDVDVAEAKAAWREPLDWN